MNSHNNATQPTTVLPASKKGKKRLRDESDEPTVTHSDYVELMYAVLELVKQDGQMQQLIARQQQMQALQNKLIFLQIQRLGHLESMLATKQQLPLPGNSLGLLPNPSAQPGSLTPPLMHRFFSPLPDASNDNTLAWPVSAVRPMSPGS